MLAPIRDNPSRKNVVQAITWPAPVEGWDAISPLADMKETRAVQLKNWFPQPGYLEIRRGYEVQAQAASGSTSIESLLVYHAQNSSNDKLYAAGGGTIYDVSSATVTSAVTSLTNNRWQQVNYTNSANNYLYIVNGVDNAAYYDGTSWTTNPSISGVSSSSLIHINVHKRRLWFIQTQSTKAWYLATDAITGTATSFELGSLFNLGGYLMAMATWTIDGGFGPDDYAVFISSRGQVAVYQGTDPSSASTWGLVGVYNLPAPIGRRCFIKYGGNLLLLTVSGVLQLNLALQTDQAQVTTTAITQNINTAFNTAARSYASLFGWDMCVYPKGTRLIVNIPTVEDSAAKQYVMNTITGAWCEYDNHNANCWAIYKDRIFFGGNKGAVYEADLGCADILTPITAVGQTAYKAPFSPGNLKHYTMIQPLVVASGTTRPAVGISTDFNETSDLSTPSGTIAASALWDSAVWDTDVWGGSTAYSADWTSTTGLGRWASIKFQSVSGSTASGGLWGTGLWGQSNWGLSNTGDQVMQVNGFVALAEVGAYV